MVKGRRAVMRSVNCHIAISLDGFVAGPNQSPENPIGEGGLRLHEWAFATEAWRRQHGLEGGDPGPDSQLVEQVVEGIGAYIMGRKMFGGGDGAWDEQWTGWWGEDPPYHVPVFVLAHHAREPLVMEGGTTFTFVTDGAASALEQARAVAGEQDVAIAGGANTIQQYLASGTLDELFLHVVPIVLGGGERLLENVGGPTLEPIEVIASPNVTHVKYRVLR
jgi:dihydrofolate reductase